ncbi:hypothetical protein B9T25_06465 [Acinetobacter sp. ANC 4470]|uniref:hypothetical protein n=1 Tax=Acinetobacter sp. ANC 4470 TaxID=1977881 RepID=UPI000A341A36|nr:hypothetical protein [Acinetobacter sp. ANC 4470]OTG68321.1 hypothetical protein B9T25_06465 [Acinetobacter sp. ANC 4470]
MNNAYIKIGDSFAVPIQFYDTEQDVGMMITNDMNITAQIVNSSNEVIASPSITVYPDQVIDAGFILLEVPASLTRLWKVGTAQLDIKLEIDGNVRHSQNIQFRIERSITQ